MAGQEVHLVAIRARNLAVVEEIRSAAEEIPLAAERPLAERRAEARMLAVLEGRDLAVNSSPGFPLDEKQTRVEWQAATWHPPYSCGVGAWDSEMIRYQLFQFVR